MFDNPRIATMPAPETKIEHIIAKVPALELKIDAPSAAQVQVNDEVFRDTSGKTDHLSDLLGMVSGMMLLHHVAVDTLQEDEDLEGHMLREKRAKEDDKENE